MAHVIRLVDFETTGMEPPAEVVEVGYCDLTSQDDGSWAVGEPVSRLCAVEAIPPEVRAVHWITLAETAGQPPFVASAFVEDSDHCAALAAHNMEFENRWLQIEGVMPLICTLKVALRVWPDAPGHSNSVLRCWLEDRGLLALDHSKASPAHRAGPDAYVSAHVLKALFAAGATGKEMAAWTREPRLLPTCPLGKFRGQKWPDVESGFLSWMLNQPTMEEDLKWNARRELDRRKAAA
jgi:exodeoxyribonuclease X